MSHSASPQDGSPPHDDDDPSCCSYSASPSPPSRRRSTGTTAATTASTPTPTPTPTPSPPPAASASTTLPGLQDEASSSPECPSPQMAAQYQRIVRQAVRRGDSSGLRRLLEAREGKINLNAYDADGQTVLHESCQRGNLELVKLLVRFGSDVRLANRDGWSAVHIAAFGGHTDILLYLMQASNLSCRRS